MKQKITPHLWFNSEAKEAAELYTSTLIDSRIKDIITLHNTPSGDTDVINIELSGQEFTLINAGPLFKFNPSISFLIACQTKEEVDQLWNKLSKGGRPLMNLGAYPFSEKYGWTTDKYGLSWQLLHLGSRPFKQKIIPTLMFVGNLAGKAEDAMKFYVSVFNNSKVESIDRYGKGEEPDIEGTVKHASFALEGQEFAAMDSALDHKFAFNEAISLMVHCDTQKEIDYYWQKLSSDPKAEQCGWLKDKFGLSWQVYPDILSEMLKDEEKEKVAKVTQAFLQMKKYDIEALKKAYQG